MTLPRGYVSFDSVQESVPSPKRIRIQNGVELETLHLHGSSPAIVFIHGGLGSLWNPYPQIDSLKSEQELVTYSLAGNGNSTDRPTQSIDGHVSDLNYLLSSLGIERPVIHGHSYGTAVALEYAKRHSVAGVILHGGGDHGLTPQWEKPFVHLVLQLRLYRIPTKDSLMRRLAHRFGFDDSTPEPVVMDFLKSNPMPQRRSAWKTVKDAFWGYDGRGDIDRVDVPTLVIHGTSDGIVPLEVARATASHLPEAVFCRIENSGHVAFVERPNAYTQLLRSLSKAVQENRRIEHTVPECAKGLEGIICE